jgi:Excreted virulence factor EspC, type VII ESX diderm
MQVDTAQLRKAAARLRQDVVAPLRGVRPRPDGNVDGAFDFYTTSAPFTEAATAWAGEIDVLVRATVQLVDALESAAEDYDKADAESARRMAAGRGTGR